jgi:hypothetical protein
MTLPSREGDQYVSELLVDLHLDSLQGKEREETIAALSERFQEVIFNTTVRVLDEKQKLEYLRAVQDPDANEQKIIEITSQAPGLAEALEAALLFEYESLKHAMAK